MTGDFDRVHNRRFSCIRRGSRDADVNEDETLLSSRTVLRERRSVLAADSWLVTIYSIPQNSPPDTSSGRWQRGEAITSFNYEYGSELSV